MKRLIALIAVVGLCAVAQAGETPHATTTRVGAPVTTPQLTITDYTGMDAPPPGTSPSGDPQFDVSLPKQVYDAGEPVVLTTHLHGRTGDIDGGTVIVEDDHARGNAHGQAKGKGRHAATLDTTPGEHFLTVSSDAVIDGTSVHRAASHHYVVANGHVKIVTVGAPHVSADALLVPLTMVSKPGGWVNVSATLTTATTVVARTELGLHLDKGTTVVDVPFPHADLVEPGPYQLVDVTVEDTDPRDGPQLAAALAASPPFNSPLAPTGYEPAGHAAFAPLPLVLPTPQGEGDDRVNPGVVRPAAPVVDPPPN